MSALNWNHCPLSIRMGVRFELEYAFYMRGEAKFYEGLVLPPTFQVGPRPPMTYQARG